MLGMAIAVVGVLAVFAFRARQPAPVRLRFTAVVGDKELVFNDPLYANPGGSGVFSVRDFLVYLSNIQLVGAAGTYRVPESYHLVRFDNASRSYELVLEAVPRDAYSKVILSIGLDEDANASITAVGDLDPNGRMAWNWEVGYKFVLLEGTLVVDDELRPLPGDEMTGVADALDTERRDGRRLRIETKASASFNFVLADDLAETDWSRHQALWKR